MCVYIIMCMYLYATRVRPQIHVSAYLYVYVCVCVYMNLRVQLYVNVDACIFVFITVLYFFVDFAVYPAKYRWLPPGLSGSDSPRRVGHQTGGSVHHFSVYRLYCCLHCHRHFTHRIRVPKVL